MKDESGYREEAEAEDPRAAHALTSLEKGFSYQAAAAKCEEVSAQLVRLAELLRCTRPDPAAPHCVLSERAMIECLIRGRRLRERFFDQRLFADPAWDILLELYLARLEQRRVSISSLCIAAAVPPTTALRHIRTLVEENIISRQPNPFDGRVAYAELTETAFVQMREYYVRYSELLRAAIGG